MWLKKLEQNWSLGRKCPPHWIEIGINNGRQDEALTLVLQVLQNVEAWVQSLQQAEMEVAQPSLDTAQQVKAQDVQVNEEGKASLIEGVAKDRRISIEDGEMRHGRKSSSLRVDGYKRHVLHESSHRLDPSCGDHACQRP
jgi:hypothetical protein